MDSARQHGGWVAAFVAGFGLGVVVGLRLLGWIGL